jgi:uncharacterized protein YjbJ (UPF0337 family)
VSGRRFFDAENAMNKDQIKGTARSVGGKVQSGVGKATGNGTQQIKGTAREMAGKVQKEFGNLREDSKTKP